jgi:hypothetical protein
MQVGEQDLVLAQHGALLRLGLLDLDDHLGGGENVGRRGGDRRAGGDVIRVGTHDAGAGIGLDQHLVAMGDRLCDAARGHADPVFVILDLLGYTDEHGSSSQKTVLNSGGSIIDIQANVLAKLPGKSPHFRRFLRILASFA